MSVRVTKRAGHYEAYQTSKVKAVIAHATKGLNVNPLVLESKFDETIYDGMPTQLINENLTHHARTLCSADEPEWTFAAGRIKTFGMWADTGAYDVPFNTYMSVQIFKGRYTHPSIKESYSAADFRILGDLIVKDRDTEHSYGSVLTASKKYLLKGECIQQMHMVNSMIIASVEKDYDTRMTLVGDIYEALSNRKISLATPWLSNLRSNGNISSCFILQIDDDLDSIYDNLKNAARISKNGGGVGIDISRIRAAGASINGRKGASGGVVGWIKLFNDTAVAVDQCFAEETVVDTARGELAISDVVVGDLVKTHDGSYKPVTAIHTGSSRQPDETFHEIATSSGVVRVTGGHPIFVAIPNRKMTASELKAALKANSSSVTCKWIEAKDLAAGSFVIHIS